MRKQIIGISGKIGSGKDTFAELLAKELKNTVERHALADKLRLITEIISGVNMSVTHEKGNPFCNEIRNYTQEQKNIILTQYNRTIGETLQLVGTELFRDNYDNDIWVKSFFNESLKQKILEGKVVVVPDVRFINEADYILNNGGYLIRLEGDPADVRKNSLRDLNHSSETNLDGYQRFNKVIHNNNGIENLKNTINDLITELSLR